MHPQLILRQTARPAKSPAGSLASAATLHPPPDLSGFSQPSTAPLLNIDDINYGLLLPIFAHCVDDQGHPLLGPTRKGPEGKAFLRKAYTDIPAVVEAMRQYWMPTRYRRDA